jgi:hypothetical protein
MSATTLGVVGPVTGDDLRDREAFARVFDRGSQELRYRQLAELRVQREPGVDGARHAHGQRSVDGNRRQPLRAKVLERQRTRRSAAAVAAHETLLGGIPNDREQIPADSRARGLYEPEHRVRGDGRVHGAAAGPQSLDPDGSRERLARRNHAVLGHDDRARREMLAVRTIH